MSRDDWEVEEGQEVVRRTIVGGRPLDRRRRKVKIPIGIEKLLCRAAGDPALRDRLVNDREAALAAFRDDLSPGEIAILTTVPAEALLTMIANIDLKQHGRRRFFRGVAAASLAATTALGTISCSESAQPAGIDPGDWLGNQDVIVDQIPASDSVRGIQPDEVDAQMNFDLGSQSDEPESYLEDVQEIDVLEPIDVGAWADETSTPDQTSPPPDVVEVDDALDGGIWAEDTKDADVIDVDEMAGGGIWPDPTD
jgi:hypothetical protein